MDATSERDYTPCHDHVEDAFSTIGMHHNPNFLCSVPIPVPIPHTPSPSRTLASNDKIDGKTTGPEEKKNDGLDDAYHDDDGTRSTPDKDTGPPTCTRVSAEHNCGTLLNYCSAASAIPPFQQHALFDHETEWLESICIEGNPSSPSGCMKRKNSSRMEWGKGIKLNNLSLRRGQAMRPESSFHNVDRREAPQIGPESAQVKLDEREARQMKTAACAQDTKKELKNTGAKLVVKNTFLVLDYDEHIPKTGLHRAASCPPRLFGGRCSTRKNRKQLYSGISLTEEILAFESSLGICAHQTLGSHFAKILSSEDDALQQFEMSIGLNRLTDAPAVPHSGPDLPPMSAPGLKRNGVKNPMEKHPFSPYVPRRKAASPNCMLPRGQEGEFRPVPTALRRNAISSSAIIRSSAISTHMPFMASSGAYPGSGGNVGGKWVSNAANLVGAAHPCDSISKKSAAHPPYVVLPVSRATLSPPHNANGGTNRAAQANRAAGRTAAHAGFGPTATAAAAGYKFMDSGDNAAADHYGYGTELAFEDNPSGRTVVDARNARSTTFHSTKQGQWGKEALKHRTGGTPIGGGWRTNGIARFRSPQG